MTTERDATPWANGPVHFMGVGGAGMRALAEAMLRRGIRVSGCDASAADPDPLPSLGAETRVGHDPAHVADATALVVTAAVPADHPEIEAARARGIPVLKRAEALGRWVATGTVAAVSGTHGKTTTTAMLATVLAAADRNPTAFVGGRVSAWGSNLRAGGDDLFVVEADEFDRSFLHLRPDVAIVTNVEPDHLDVYGDSGAVDDAFRAFLQQVRDDGRIVACSDDPGAGRVAQGVGAALVTYGLSAGSMVRATEPRFESGVQSARVTEEGRDAGLLSVRLPGRHNLVNALGAAAAARALDVSWPAIRDGLDAFRGVARRFERLGDPEGVTVIDDYAHHPTEVAATLSAARQMFPDRPLVAVFQPHLFTRTRDFHAEFGRALTGADRLWVTDVYPAREAPIDGVTGALVSTAATAAGSREVRYHAGLDGLVEALAGVLSPGDVCITLGAGSIERVGPALVARLSGSPGVIESESRT